MLIGGNFVFSSISNVLCLTLISIGLSGCIYAGGAEAVKQIDPAIANGAHVGSITVTLASDVTSPELERVMPEVLRRELNSCATGSQSLSLVVNVTRFKGQNAAKTILLGDGAELQGTAKLIEPETNRIVADYDVSESVGGGGLFAAAGMADSERSLSREFADSLCKQAFNS